MNRLGHILLFCTLIAVSCVREEFPYNASDEDANKVDVVFNLSVSREVGGTRETKAIDDPSNVASTIIRNVNILQFAGTSDDARLVGEVTYLSDTEDENDEEKYLLMEDGKISKIKLAESQGEKHTIVILTNTFEKLRQVSTLGEMKALFRTFYRDYDVFGYEGDGNDFPGGDDHIYYQRMNAMAVTEITNGTVLRANLRRSMARIKLNITNDGTDNLKIKSVQLRDVAGKDYYLTDYHYIADPATRQEDSLFVDSFQDHYDPGDPKRIHYDPVEWPVDKNGVGEASFQFYVPSNQRGVYAANKLPQEKNRCPNVSGATHVRISATYGPGDTEVIYTFYLGANLVNDFNICPNTSYTYELSFSGKGNCNVDNRIDDLAPVHFNLDANCYMLPIPKASTRTYTFNATHRPTIFWGKERYGVGEKFPNYTIDIQKQWYARILWTDFEMTQEQAKAFLVKDNGSGKGGYMDMDQRIKVVVPAEMEGNVVVGIYVDHPDNIIWSWHLWITDYQPDDIEDHAPESGRFIYPVTGGEVHRYNGRSWTQEDGRYKNGYAMDRALGALDAVTQGDNRGGGLKYQWGRKDPFRGGAYATWVYDKDGNPTKFTGDLSIVSNTSEEIAEYLNGYTIPFTVNNPTKRLEGCYASWHSNDSDLDATIEWNDPKCTDREANEEDSTKSFLDPCPLGWRVPCGATPEHYLNTLNFPQTINCYSDFTGGDRATDNESVNAVKGVDPYGRGDAVTYFPEGYLASMSQQTPQAIYFPFPNWGEGYYLTSLRRPGVLYQCYGLRVSMWHDGVLNYITYYEGLSAIRCVREDYR